jgi:hypothetical protein
MTGREPWTNWNTVEADPASLPSIILGRTIERDTAREQRDSARRFAAALESRLAEVHDILTNAPADRRVRIRQAVRLIEADLT